MTDPQSYRPTSVPDEPGVYRFFNPENQVIYVGKARSLKNRLNSYFQKNLDSKTERMVRTANRVDWTVVNSEMEALQLEYTWIKEENPEFNVQFKDDKSYPYLALSMKEEFPRIFITRRRKAPGNIYFGPFAHAWALRSTFDLIIKLFPVRSCSQSNFESAQRSKRQCLLGDIGKCSAPCVGWISSEEHRGLVAKLQKFLDHGGGDISATLRDEMSKAAEAEDFERAGKIRDQLAALDRAMESHEASISETISGDFVAIHDDITHSGLSVFRIRAGRVVGSRSWIMDRTHTVDDSQLISAALEQIYREFEIPSEIYVNREGEIEAFGEYLSSRAGKKVVIRIPERGEKSEILDTVKRNAHQALIQFLSKRANDAGVSGRALEELAQQLDLDELPLRIECFDISNIQGTSVVASMVVFEDGQPKKSDYRRFAIDDNEKFDDTRAMHHVITRRFKRYLAEKDIDVKEIEAQGGTKPKFAYPPQLLIVDGGRGQVNAAARALAELGITNIPLVGLAKRLEEIWFPHRSYPVILPRHGEALYLVQRVRDEAHRFAVTFHRSKRSHLMLESLLDEIPSLGEVRIKALIDYFGSVAALRKASVDEIGSVPGIGEKTARIIKSFLEESSASSFIDTQTGEIIERP
ncbi:MAG: excinuclease ABC subunit UvrC [Actinobacteria bacterium]|jgi:excinuclease ABC subunit C|nr:excinuclease ABC subunit UvrC [Actinomycetota bacterium]